MIFADYVAQTTSLLQNVQTTLSNRDGIPADSGFKAWLNETYRLSRKKKTMYFIGNGASAMMAGHMAADAAKNGGFRAQAFNDAALLTAVSNDMSYEDSFALPLSRHGDHGDILVAISSSGNSGNIIKAIVAAQKTGMFVVTLTGMKPENQARQLGDLNFYIQAESYGLVESCHQVLLHFWLDLYIEHSSNER